MTGIDTSLSRRGALAFGVVDLIAAAVVALGVFGGLPERWWPVDVVAVLLVLALAAAGAGLVRRASWARAVARVASMATLVVGLALVAMLAVTASFLNGIYGPVGHGGAIVLILVAALALPYLVALPAGELVWLRPTSTSTSTSTSTPTSTSTS